MDEETKTAKMALAITGLMTIGDMLQQMSNFPAHGAKKMLEDEDLKQLMNKIICGEISLILANMVIDTLIEFQDKLDGVLVDNEKLVKESKEFLEKLKMSMGNIDFKTKQ